MSTGEVMYLLLVVAVFGTFSAAVYYAMGQTKDIGNRH